MKGCGLGPCTVFLVCRTRSVVAFISFLNTGGGGGGPLISEANKAFRDFRMGAYYYIYTSKKCKIQQS